MPAQKDRRQRLFRDRNVGSHDVTSFFTLTSAEAMVAAEPIKALRPQSWSGAPLERAGERRLFEVRSGRALHDCGVAPFYEHGTGVGETSVDFAFEGWNVELLSFDETDAAKASIWENGPNSVCQSLSPISEANCLTAAACFCT